MFQWFCVSYVICVNVQSTSVFASLKHSLGMGNSLWHGEALGKSLALGVWALPKISAVLCISRLLCHEHWIMVQHRLFVEPARRTRPILAENLAASKEKRFGWRNASRPTRGAAHIMDRKDPILECFVVSSFWKKYSRPNCIWFNFGCETQFLVQPISPEDVAAALSLAPERADVQEVWMT